MTGIGVDTNVLLRAYDSASPESRRCRTFLSANVGRLCGTDQTLREVYRVLTGVRNGVGVPAAVGLGYVARTEAMLNILPPHAGTLPLWKRLLQETGAVGLRAHDAYLAASFLAHGIEQVATLDADFRYPGLTLVSP